LAQFVGGRYQLIAQLGGGGMADVYLAKLTGKADFAKLAVVKRLKPVEDDDPEIIRMFADEARLCARLNHPSIVQTFEVGEDTTGPFLVMEYLEGQPLGRIRSRATRRNIPIPRGIALKILRDTIGALSYAHSLVDHDGTPLRVVHRDVSPENIMVTYAGLTKLVDFGVAKTAASMSRTRAGVLKGKVAYMAPEQARSDVNIDERADVFAVGLILWEMLTTKRLWEGFSEAKVFERLLDREPLPPPNSVNPDVPDELNDICVRAMEKEKDERFATASDLLDALEEACHKHSLRASDREIGQFVSGLFEGEREKVRQLVSGTMTRKEDPAAPTTSGVPQHHSKPVDPNAPPKPEESDPLLWRALSSGALSSPLAPDPASMPVSNTPAGVVDPTRMAFIEPPRPPSRGGRVFGVFVALALLVGLGAVAIIVGTKLGTDDPRKPVHASATTASVSSETPVDVSVEIVIKPVTAKLTVDGKAVTNPFHLKTLKGDTAHEIRAEAEGYESRTLQAAWDRDRSLDISLVKLEQAANTPPPAPPPVQPTRVATTAHPAPHTPPSHPPSTTSHPSTSTTTASTPSNPPSSASSRSGISEIDPASKPKAGTKHDKIDTDVFKR
jgi:eukaryotic-like serine/threonine-protein kinase